MKPQKTHSSFTVLDGIFWMLSKYMYLLFVYNILSIFIIYVQVIKYVSG